MVVLAGTIILFCSSAGPLAAQDVGPAAPDQVAAEGSQELEVRALLEQLNSGKQATCFRAVGELSVLGRDALPYIWKHLDDASPSAQRYLLIALGRMKTPRAVAGLVDRLDRFHPSVLPMAVNVVAASGPETSARALRPLLATEDLVAKCVVLEALLRLKDDTVIEDLVEIFCEDTDDVPPPLDDPAGPSEPADQKERVQQEKSKERDELRSFAFRKLRAAAKAGELGTEAIDSLVSYLRSAGPEQAVRTIHILAYSEGGKAVLEELEQLLTANDEAVREAAAYAVGNLGTSANGPALLSALINERDEGVAETMIEALQSVDYKPAVPCLIEYLDHTNRKLVIAAWKAVKSLTGKTFPAEYDAWYEWWDGIVAGGEPVTHGAELLE